jgi:23S rRNA pseudouridine1911/1915/1917 synthase
MITRLKREKDGILRDNKILRTVDTVHSGETIVINLPSEDNYIEPVKGDIDIIFEDRYLLAVNKPPSTPVHPTKIHQLDTLANYLSYRMLETGEKFTFRVLNRLDKDTSGIVIIAKDKYTAFALNKNIDKVYYAVCEGKLEGRGTIDTPIRLSDNSKIVRTVSLYGKPAITHYESLKTNGAHTLLRITLDTGRTHQIRCHMASVGHPLAGDDLYGGSLDLIRRQALHCAEAAFIHPVTNKKIYLKTPLPTDMQIV